MSHGIWLSKPAVFMFLLVTVGVSAAAIATGVAERENRVYDVSAVQKSITNMAEQADRQLDYQEEKVCDLIKGVSYDLKKVEFITGLNRFNGNFRVGFSSDNCSEKRYYRPRPR